MQVERYGDIPQAIQPGRNFFETVDNRFREYQQELNKLVSNTIIYNGQNQALLESAQRWININGLFMLIDLSSEIPTLDISSPTDCDTKYPIKNGIGARWISLLNSKGIQTPFDGVPNALYIPQHFVLATNLLNRRDCIGLFTYNDDVTKKPVQIELQNWGIKQSAR